jgi:hypothetical protein
MLNLIIFQSANADFPQLLAYENETVKQINNHSLIQTKASAGHKENN